MARDEEAPTPVDSPMRYILVIIFIVGMLSGLWLPRRRG